MTGNSNYPIQPSSPQGQRAVENIILFGEVLIDCFPDREVQGGAPFNVACHLLGLGRGMGLMPILVTRIGKDERGRRLLDTMQSLGLPIDGVQQDSLRPTGEVRVHFDAAGQGHCFDIVPDQAWDYIHPQMAHLVGLLSRPEWLYFGTLAQRNSFQPPLRQAANPALRTLLQTTRARTFLDLNLRDPWVSESVLRWSLEKAEIVKMNDLELLRIADMLELGEAEPAILGSRLIHAFDLSQLLVTEGEKGAWLLRNDGSCQRTNATEPITDLIDTVGAGDGFAAVFLLGLVLGWPPAQTLQRAHQFAGQICRMRGAVPDSLTFYTRFISNWQLDHEATA